jgi:hypothetical protein
VGVRLIEAIRPGLLLDPDPGWAVPRYLLWIALLSVTSAAGALAAALFILWVRGPVAPTTLAEVPLSTRTLAVVGGGALAAGALFRFAWLDTIPLALWVDDVSLIEPTLALTGSWRDFANSIRPAPFGVAEPFGSVGVLYLELYRLCLELAGTTVFGVRLPSALAGVASVGTAMLLGRALLPKGGGTLAGVALAGLRWNLILSRWGWVAIVLAPMLDVAALLLIASRRRRSAALAAAAGLVAGLAAHVYLAAWIGAGALVLIAAWPQPDGEEKLQRLPLVLAFALAMTLAASPIFLLTDGRTSPYFARASNHNVALEIERAKSLMPLAGVATDALAAPWFLPDPTPRHDLPRRARLGWIVGSFVAVAFAFALLRPRQDFSAYLLASALAAFAATVIGGRATAPNGYRFGYLSNAAAVAAAGGALVALGMFPESRRRVAAVSFTGLLAIASFAGARALLVWGEARATFDNFGGQDTLIARSAARWDSYGRVDLDPEQGENPLTIVGARKYRLDPGRETGNGKRETTRERRQRRFRIVAPEEAPREGERLVERVQDDWGREWAWVYGSRATRGTPTRAAS